MFPRLLAMENPAQELIGEKFDRVPLERLWLCSLKGVANSGTSKASGSGTKISLVIGTQGHNRNQKISPLTSVN